MNRVEEILEHAGVKGMKWGVRKDQVKSSIKTKLDSMSRERQWKQQIKKAGKMSNEEVAKMTNRIRMENELKRLSKSKGVGTKEDKQNYLKRSKVSDSDLNNMVTQLRAKDNLNRVAKEASSSQVATGKRVAIAAANIGIKYALTGNIDTKDVGKALFNPNTNVKGAVIDAVFEKTNRKVVSRKGDR